MNNITFATKGSVQKLLHAIWHNIKPEVNSDKGLGQFACIAVCAVPTVLFTTFQSLAIINMCGVLDYTHTKNRQQYKL